MHLTDTGSVDHFRPKGKHPHLAYEWDNYRLARQKVNSRKGETEQVLDPFEVQPGWFVLDFPSCLVRPGGGLSRKIRKNVIETINILQLNGDDNLVQERCNWLMFLVDGDISMKVLDQRYPFLAVEIRRQKMEQRLKGVFKKRR